MQQTMMTQHEFGGFISSMIVDYKTDLLAVHARHALGRGHSCVSH